MTNKIQCRNCIHFEKREGNKRLNTDYGICKLLSLHGMNNETTVFSYERESGQKNEKNIVVLKNHYAQVITNTFSIEIKNEAIFSSFRTLVDGDFFCAAHNIPKDEHR
jgi:hypothetical protein